MDYTRFIKLEAKKEVKSPLVNATEKVVTPEVNISGLDDENCLVAVSDGAAAAGSTPTKAEFDAVVALVNDLKAKHNALLLGLQTGVTEAAEE